MDRKQPIKRNLMRKSFLGLHQTEILADIISSHINNPYEEVVIRGGLNEDYIFGIVVEVYKNEYLYAEGV